MRDDAARALRVDEEGFGAQVAELEAIRTRTDVERSRERRQAQRSARRAAEAARPIRTAPGRAYGSHRRADVTGPQPGRRTIEITGQPMQPRRRSHTTAAMVSHPDRTALWAFLFALFLVLMAVATAHG